MCIRDRLKRVSHHPFSVYIKSMCEESAMPKTILIAAFEGWNDASPVSYTHLPNAPQPIVRAATSCETRPRAV